MASIRSGITWTTGAALLGFAVACSPGAEETAPPAEKPEMEEEAAAEAPAGQALQARAAELFGVLPARAESPTNPITEEKIELGRVLYYDPRLSKNHDISCNSCHMLDNFGVDNEPTSPGHKGQRGDRNSPTVYNAAFHLAQFWDGRAPDVEEQAKGPVLNPVEMAHPSEEQVVIILRSIPGYVEMFAAAYPGEADPITYDNMAKAIGAFERGLVTPSPFDRYLEGDVAALTEQQQRGLELFLDSGCTTCHVGPAVGGGMYQKLGLVHAYDTEDTGREKATGNAAERFFFKVPSLRNVEKTRPYFHDGSIASLDEAVKLMAWHQLGKTLSERQVTDIVSFLGSLTGSVDAEYVAMPPLPESSDSTPPPDPT